jgi:hypothetical protein
MANSERRAVDDSSKVPKVVGAAMDPTASVNAAAVV